MPECLSTLLYFLTGLAITIIIEIVALSTGRWRYEPQMSAGLGIGLMPPLQWTVIAAAALVLFRRGQAGPARAARGEDAVSLQ